MALSASKLEIKTISTGKAFKTMFKSPHHKKIIKEVVKPYYHSIKDAFDFRGKRLLEKNSSIKTLFCGKRCFLVCPGASLEQIDVTKLKDEYTAGIGWIGLHKAIENINLKMFLRSIPIKSINTCTAYPDYYYNAICSGHKDKTYETRYREACKQNIDRAYLFLKILDDVLVKGAFVFIHPNDYKFITNRSLFENKNVYYIKILNTFNRHKKNIQDVSIDFTKRFIGGTGAVFNSILTLIYMGFREIYLCGAGYTYSPAYELHFYDNYVFPKECGYEKASELAKSIVDIHNKKHYSNMEYFGLFEKDNVYKGIYVSKGRNNSADMNEHRVISKYAKSEGVKIYNIVPEGFESPIYEKISWEDVVGLVLANDQKQINKYDNTV